MEKPAESISATCFCFSSCFSLCGCVGGLCCRVLFYFILFFNACRQRDAGAFLPTTVVVSTTSLSLLPPPSSPLPVLVRSVKEVGKKKKATKLRLPLSSSCSFFFFSLRDFSLFFLVPSLLLVVCSQTCFAAPLLLLLFYPFPPFLSFILFFFFYDAPLVLCRVGCHHASRVRRRLLVVVVDVVLVFNSRVGFSSRFETVAEQRRRSPRRQRRGLPLRAYATRDVALQQASNAAPGPSPGQQHRHQLEGRSSRGRSSEDQPPRKLLSLAEQKWVRWEQQWRRGRAPQR